MSGVDDRDGSLAHEAEEAFVERDGDFEDSVGQLASDFDRSESTDGTAAEQLRGLIWYIVGNLADDPETVDVTVNQNGSTVQITVHLPEDELGKVIGRGGRIAKAIRTALTIAGSRNHLRVSLDIEGKTAPAA